MHLIFQESQLQHFASAYELNALEAVVIGMKDAVVAQGFLTLAQLHTVAKWKSARSADHVLKNSESFVREITGFALRATDERARIEVFTVLDGVLWPSASVLLHLFHTEKYPILDFRALESVDTTVPNQYTFEFWWEYVLFCRNLARRTGMEMRELDRALWQHSAKGQRSDA